MTVDLIRYPKGVPPDSIAGEICRMLAFGLCLHDTAHEALRQAWGADYPGPRWLPQFYLRVAAIQARDLNAILVFTPCVTIEEIASILDAPSPRCGEPTKTGRPCARTVPIAGMTCHNHPEPS